MTFLFSLLDGKASNKIIRLENDYYRVMTELDRYYNMKEIKAKLSRIFLCSL